jgi:PAS domain S-box-containing protein
LKDTQGRYLHVNRPFQQQFHLSLEQTVGKTDAEIFPPDQAAVFRANDLKVIESGVSVQFDETARHDDGPHISIVTKFPLFDLEGRIYAIGGIVTDITERKRLEAEVLHISDREQRRIAQDLHDGLGQQLAGLWCLSDVLRNDLEAQSSSEAAKAAKIAHLLNRAVTHTRSLARGLHPVEPEPHGLMSALEALATSITELFKVTCTFECEEPVLIEDSTVATHLYRIAQEAVNNAIKHGRARHIKVGLAARPERFILKISNDGMRFKKVTGRKMGLGLRIMQYRADMIGGELVIEKKSGGGATVICVAPRSGGVPVPPAPA